MSYALEGPKWNSPVITWSFANTSDPNSSQFTGAIDSADQAVVERALAKWASVANITFQQVSDTTSGVDIRIGWSEFGTTSGQIGDTVYWYTQAGSTETFVPGTSVELEDPSERPLTGDASNPVWQGTSTTLYQVALHEIGHALGMDHSPDDPDAVMYHVSTPSNTDLDQSDIAGIQALYGAPSARSSQTVAASTTSSAGTTQAASGTTSTTPIASSSTAPIASGTIAPITSSTTGTSTATGSGTGSGTGTSVYRFLDTTDGTHFFTANAAEAANTRATRSDMRYEGVGMNATDAGDPNGVAVYRFLDSATGTHFYTASGSEKDSILAARSDLHFEGVGFYEHATQQAGDAAVYRFLDTSNGTHFYSSSPAEISSITASRPDLRMEGVAFYAPAS